MCCKVALEAIDFFRESPLAESHHRRCCDFRETQILVVVNVVNFGRKDLVTADVEREHALLAGSVTSGFVSAEIREELLVPERGPKARIVMIALRESVLHIRYSLRSKRPAVRSGVEPEELLLEIPIHHDRYVSSH